jgi:hypothetical protein
MVQLSKSIKALISDAIFYSQKVYDEAAKEEINEIAVSAYLNYAASLMNSAYVLYSIEPEKDDQLEKLFTQARAFFSEVLENIGERRNHQWTLAEFESFKEVFQDCEF